MGSNPDDCVHPMLDERFGLLATIERFGVEKFALG